MFTNSCVVSECSMVRRLSRFALSVDKMHSIMIAIKTPKNTSSVSTFSTVSTSTF